MPGAGGVRRPAWMSPTAGLRPGPPRGCSAGLTLHAAAT